MIQGLRASAISVVCAVGLLAPSCAKPPEQGSAAIQCYNTSEIFLTPALRAREHWYGPHLVAAGEANLCAMTDLREEAYRFTWLRSFHPSVIVRVERTDTAIHLYANQLSHAEAQDPGSPHDTRKITIDSTQWQEILELVQATGLWLDSMPEADPSPQGLDGAQWIVEGVRRGMYRAIDRWTPDERSPVRELGMILLRRAGMLPSNPELVY